MTALAFLIVFAAYLLGERAARVRSDRAAQRLHSHVARRLRRRRFDRSALTRLDRRLVRGHVMAALERRLREAGLLVRVTEALLAVAAGATALAGMAAAVWGAVAAPVAAGAGVGLAWWGLGVARERRIRRLDLQLSVTLDLFVGQLRAHRSIAEAIIEIAPRISEPLRGEWMRVAEELRLGVPLPQALEALRLRIPSRPLRTMVTAILVTDRTGGNLAEFLSRQSKTVRDQVAFLQEVKALTAHARSTAIILTLLPMGVAGGMYLLDSRFFDPLLAPGPGRMLLVSAGLMQLAGWQVIRGMIRSVER